MDNKVDLAALREAQRTIERIRDFFGKLYENMGLTNGLGNTKKALSHLRTETIRGPPPDDVTTYSKRNVDAPIESQHAKISVFLQKHVKVEGSYHWVLS